MTSKDKSSSINSSFILASAVAAHSLSVKFCDEAFKEEEKEGKAFFLDLLLCMIKYHQDMVQNNRTESLEKKLRVYEFRKFFFKYIIEELIVLVAKNCGTGELLDVELAKSLDFHE